MRQLTADEFYQLQAQFEKTPAPGDSWGASGEHFILVMMLNNMGFTNFSGKWGALKLAERLLCNGYSS